MSDIIMMPRSGYPFSPLCMTTDCSQSYLSQLPGRKVKLSLLKPVDDTIWRTGKQHTDGSLAQNGSKI